MVEEHLGHFQFGAPTNKGAVNICVQIFVEHKSFFPWDKCPGDSRIFCFFKKVAVPFNVATINA